jgi:hypothetical protein
MPSAISTRTRATRKPPLQDRFSLAFRVWLRQHLQREAHRLRRHLARQPWLRPPALLDQMKDKSEEKDDDNDFQDWQRVMLRAAESRLDHRSQLCLQLRLRGTPADEIAKRLGISPKTAANRYSLPHLVAAVQQEVRSIVEGLSAADRVRLVAHLVQVVGLTDDQVERLLCVPGEQLRGDLRAARGQAAPVVGHVEAVRLVVGKPRAMAA